MTSLYERSWAASAAILAAGQDWVLAPHECGEIDHTGVAAGFAFAVVPMPLLLVSAPVAATALRQPLFASAPENPRPNLVLLVMDDYGWGDVGYHGGTFPTPNIDNLANTGVKLERFYTQPACSPSRSSMLTGRHASSIGMQHATTIVPGSMGGIPPNVPTLAEELRDAGYATHAVGKWHLGYTFERQTPLRRGFDSFLGSLNGGTDYYDRTLEAQPNSCLPPCADSPYGYAYGLDALDNNSPAPQCSGIYSEDSYTERAEKIIRDATRPIFMYYAPQLLHSPLQLPPDSSHQDSCAHIGYYEGELVRTWDDRADVELPGINRTVYCTMVSRLDESVGRIVSAFKKRGQYENTLIWLASDNGAAVPQTEDVELGGSHQGGAGSNGPLRGSKGTLFEGGVRVPAVLGGSIIPPARRGAVSQTLLHTTDIAPTMLSLAGVTPTGKDGLDVWPDLVQNKPLGRTEILINIHVGKVSFPYRISPPPDRTVFDYDYTAIIVWPYKLIRGVPTFVWTAQMGWTGAGYGYWNETAEEGYGFRSGPNEETFGTKHGQGFLGAALNRLYNIRDDPGEFHDLANPPAGSMSEADQEALANIYERLEYWSDAESGRYQRPQDNTPLSAFNIPTRTLPSCPSCTMTPTRTFWAIFGPGVVWGR